MADAYELLGISRNASEAEIRKAHRSLARRWHPDRFQDGPERMWAESKMIEINLAYEDALRRCQKEGKGEEPAENEQLEDVRKLLGMNQLSAARQALLHITTRNAEWNYLFGAVLFRLGEVEKSLLYFSIASRQRPENAQYHTAYMSAESLLQKNSQHPALNRLFRNVRRVSR